MHPRKSLEDQLGGDARLRSCWESQAGEGGTWPASVAQRAQYPSSKEYSLNGIRDPNLIQSACLN